MGRHAWRQEQLLDGYACEGGTFTTGPREPRATVPYLVEAWAATRQSDQDAIDDEDEIYQVDIVGFSINRSPAVIDSRAYRSGRSRALSLNLGGLSLYLDVPKGAFDFALNITTPFIPILGDNKTPTLEDFGPTIKKTVESAIRRAAHNNPPILVNRKSETAVEQEEEEKVPPVFQRTAILQVLPEAIKRSGEGGFEYSQRSLFYRVRILLKNRISDEPTYNYFCSVLTDYENFHGEIDRLIRDTRGVFVEPHGGELTQMGTLTVFAYTRPPWTYSNILFLEKEDLVSALRQSGFLDRWDCFALSSKGFSSRAARDLIDKIGATGKEEPTRFFCVHDADASGSLISQTLTHATKARGARLVKVVDLGFFPWTALSEGLLRERVERKSSKRRPVADYIKARDRANSVNNPNNEPPWETWLQNWRVELNAMTTAEFVAWMNDQFVKHGAAKVVPAEELAQENVTQQIKADIFNAINEKVRAEKRQALQKLQQQIAKLETRINKEATDRANKILASVTIPGGAEVVTKISAWLEIHSDSHWRNSIQEVAAAFMPKTSE
jgi:hypothetical protein